MFIKKDAFGRLFFVLLRILTAEDYMGKKIKKKKVYKLLRQIVENFHSETDTLGSYTGLPNDKEKVPTQDGDDL